MSVTDQIRDHQARCVAPLIALRMLALGETEVPLPRWVVVEVAQATGSVMAEAEAAGRAALSAVGTGSGHSGNGTFLQVRLDRLAVAASDAIDAARAGDYGEMRRHLLRFDALTSAIWTVEDALSGRHPASGTGPAGSLDQAVRPADAGSATLPDSISE
jgi:hypothetical protein